MEKFGVIIADCPWKYSNYTSPKHGAPTYETMRIEDIKELPVKDWAASNCVLLFWTTFPMLNHAIPIIESWGFNYVTGLPWVKTTQQGNIRRGIGFWTQSASELLLIARVGKPSRKTERSETSIGLLVDEPRVFYAPIGRHSKKPEDVQDWAEKNFTGPYLELFSRRNRDKWTCWGLDTGWRLTKDGPEKL
jgi:N6-adenosine-specific RNA methylase IME4